jgi:hypothetical protein
MSLLRTFLSHEVSTQFRSTRYRAMGGIYVVVSTLPVIVMFVLARRAWYAIGSASYAAALDQTQPMLTMLLAAVLSTDGVTRERDEGSFPVVSLAPVSAAGYLLRRWIAVTTIALPLTLLPRIAGVVMAAVQGQRLPMLAAFAGGWLLQVLPVLVIFSAFAIGLGTICGNTTVAIVAGAMLLTGGLEIGNNLFARWHLHFDGVAELLAMNLDILWEARWSLAGYYVPLLPNEAAYPLAATVDRVLPRAALPFGIAFALLGIATMYLRRTRRDLRPWRPRPDHPLRSFIGVVNRLRDSYSPDGSIGVAEWTSVATGLLLFGAAIALLGGRARAYERLGAQRYAAYTQTDPLPMAAGVIPLSVQVHATLSGDGHIRSHGALTFRNDTSGNVTHLGFALNPLLHIGSIHISDGRLRLTRVWQRVGIDIEPPLASGQSRTLVFELDGTPGDVLIPIPWSGGWRGKWRRFVAAKDSFDLSDLSRSTIIPDVDEAHVSLDAASLLPVPRYSPWHVDPETDRFDDETVQATAPIHLVLSQPFATIADSCGHVATRGASLQSDCTMALGSYRVAGGPLATAFIAPDIQLAYIPAQESLVKVQGPALAGAVARVESAWRGLRLARPIVYVETPTDLRQRPNTMLAWRALRDIGGSGTLQLIPENVFIRYRGIDEGMAAGALIVNALGARRTVAANEAAFFSDFYRVAASRRVGAPRRATAVVPSLNTPVRASLLSRFGRDRLEYVTYALEARAGGEHVVEGINDFAAAGPQPGTARELFAAIGHRAGMDLSRMYADYVAGDKAPRLTLADVTYQRAAGSWEVRGTLQNNGTGEALCPLTLRTANGSLQQMIRVDSGQRAPFVFTTSALPHTLQLDPDRTCYRETYVGAVENVDYRGGS